MPRQATTREPDRDCFEERTTAVLHLKRGKVSVGAARRGLLASTVELLQQLACDILREKPQLARPSRDSGSPDLPPPCEFFDAEGRNQPHFGNPSLPEQLSWKQ